MRYSGNFKMAHAHREKDLTLDEAQTWIITDGAVGMEAQGLAVARAVDLPFSLIKVSVSGWTASLPPFAQRLRRADRLLRVVRSNKPLTAPWPRLIISVGRRAVPVVFAIKRLSQSPIVIAHIQDPNVPARLFDLVAAPIHDGLKGENVIETFGSVHSVTQERLQSAAETFATRLAHLPHPRVAVILGGKSKAFDFPVDVAKALGARLAAMTKETGGSLLVTPSRRTPKDAFDALCDELRDVPGLIWDGAGENPYFAFLGTADAIVVTADSVNMVTEAAGTGKPVLVQPLPGSSKRLGAFHAKMREAGATRPFQGRLEQWTYEPVNDTEKVARAIRTKLGLAD